MVLGPYSLQAPLSRDRKESLEAPRSKPWRVLCNCNTDILQRFGDRRSGLRRQGGKAQFLLRASAIFPVHKLI